MPLIIHLTILIYLLYRSLSLIIKSIKLFKNKEQMWHKLLAIALFVIGLFLIFIILYNYENHLYNFF